MNGYRHSERSSWASKEMERPFKSQKRNRCHQRIMCMNEPSIQPPPEGLMGLVLLIYTKFISGPLYRDSSHLLPQLKQLKNRVLTLLK